MVRRLSRFNHYLLRKTEVGIVYNGSNRRLLLALLWDSLNSRGRALVIYEVGERIDVARSSSTLPSYPPAILYFHCRNFAKQRNGIWELARECIVENSFYSDIVTNLRGTEYPMESEICRRCNGPS